MQEPEHYEAECSVLQRQKIQTPLLRLVLQVQCTLDYPE